MQFSKSALIIIHLIVFIDTLKLNFIVHIIKFECMIQKKENCFEIFNTQN